MPEIKIHIMKCVPVTDTIPRVKVLDGLSAGDLVAFRESDNSYRVFRLEADPDESEFQEENFPYDSTGMFRFVAQLPA